MDKKVIGFKAFRVDSNGVIHFLFHAHNGSSKVIFNKWLEAKAKWVIDGSRATKYRSGFHFLRTEADVEKFKKLTKNKYVILPVYLKNIRKKPRTNVGSWIGRYLYVPEIKV